jgi:septal ring factor EnvC (AmiA/AmiB activator)
MSESQPERPTFWIVLSVVLLLVAVGLGVWAITAERAKDDAQQELASLQKVAAQQQDKTTAAEQARSALEEALERAKDAGATAKACLQKAIDAIDDAFSSGSIASAIARLQDLVGECRDAAT